MICVDDCIDSSKDSGKLMISVLFVVAEVIKKLVNNPKFEVDICAKINSKIDTVELETEHKNLKNQPSLLTHDGFYAHSLDLVNTSDSLELQHAVKRLLRSCRGNRE